MKILQDKVEGKTSIFRTNVQCWFFGFQCGIVGTDVKGELATRGAPVSKQFGKIVPIFDSTPIGSSRTQHSLHQCGNADRPSRTPIGTSAARKAVGPFPASVLERRV
jgi:hypothetical protein